MASPFSAIPIISHLTIALSLLFASTTSFNGVNGELMIETYQREFDYFRLALQWPGTYCRNTRYCCRKNACCGSSGPPMYFTIHGLWADYNDGTWPACCTKSPFHKNEISTLVDALEEYWPTLSCGSSSTCDGHRGSFWAHEWEKHGTCSSPVIKDEYQYFLTGLVVYFKYNITEILSAEGYLPSNSEMYPLGGIISAIENAFHQSPMVVCSGDAVEEIHLCFHKNFQPRECADSSRISCPKYVSLPIYDPELINVGAFKSITI